LVIADFSAGQISSDGGALLLREAVRSLKLGQRLGAGSADFAWVGGSVGRCGGAAVRRIMPQLSSAWSWQAAFRQAAARSMAAV